MGLVFLNTPPKTPPIVGVKLLWKNLDHPAVAELFHREFIGGNCPVNQKNMDISILSEAKFASFGKLYQYHLRSMCFVFDLLPFCIQYMMGVGLLGYVRIFDKLSNTKKSTVKSICISMLHIFLSPAAGHLGQGGHLEKFVNNRIYLTLFESHRLSSSTACFSSTLSSSFRIRCLL